MALLPAIGDLTYNGYTFDSLHKSRVTAKPAYTPSGMTVKHVQYVIRVEAVISTVGATDTTLENIRRRLMAPAGDLYYTNKGLGTNVTVNVPGGPGDVDWGPKPEMFEWTPLGDTRSSLCTWQVSFCIPECTGAQYQNYIMAFDYGVDFSIDSDGYTERRVHGLLEIPITRTRPRLPKVPDSADAYRERTTPEVPLGFQRIAQSFTVSLDKKRLDFSYVDRELPQPLPPHCTLCDIDYTLEGNMGPGSGFQVWTAAFVGTINVAKTQPKSLAFTRFALLVRDKMKDMAKIGGTVIPQRFMVTDQVFGRGTHFNVAFTVSGLPIEVILRAGRMWQPIADKDAGGNAHAWKQSMVESDVFSARGYARAKHTAGDLIIDLCDRKPKQVFDKVLPEVREHILESGPLAPGVVDAFDAGINAETSWIQYRCPVEYHEFGNVIRHKPLEFKVKQKLDQLYTPGDGKLKSSSGPAAAPKGATSNTVDDIFQRVAGPSYDIAIYGFALRIGFRVPMPKLVTVGGRKAIEVNRRQKEGIYSMAGGIPIFFSAWRIDYQLVNGPNALPVPQNPQFGLSGIGT